MNVEEFQIQFERTIGDFSEVFNCLNVFEELGMYVDLKIVYKSSSYRVNVSLYNSLEDLFPVLSFKTKILPVADEILDFIQTTNMLKAYLSFSVDGNNLTVTVYDKVSTNSSVSYEIDDVGTNFTLLSFNVLVQKNYKDIVECIIPLLNKYSKACLLRQKYENILELAFDKNGCRLTVLLPTNDSNVVKHFISRFNALQSILDDAKIRFSSSMQKKSMFLKITIFANDEQELKTALSKIRYI